MLKERVLLSRNNNVGKAQIERPQQIERGIVIEYSEIHRTSLKDIWVEEAAR